MKEGKGFDGQLAQDLETPKGENFGLKNSQSRKSQNAQRKKKVGGNKRIGERGREGKR